RVVEQIRQRVGETLGLDQLIAFDLAGRAHDRVTGARQHSGIRIDRPGAVLEFPDEAVVKAQELRLLGFAQIDVREQTPDPYREVTYERIFDLSEPSEEARDERARYTVRQQKVEILLKEDRVEGVGHYDGSRRRSRG